jgi:hypothetical protein
MEATKNTLMFHQTRAGAKVMSGDDKVEYTIFQKEHALFTRKHPESKPEDLYHLGSVPLSNWLFGGVYELTAVDKSNVKIEFGPLSFVSEQRIRGYGMPKKGKKPGEAEGRKKTDTAEERKQAAIVRARTCGDLYVRFIPMEKETWREIQQMGRNLGFFLSMALLFWNPTLFFMFMFIKPFLFGGGAGRRVA